MQEEERKRKAELKSKKAEERAARAKEAAEKRSKAAEKAKSGKGRKASGNLGACRRSQTSGESRDDGESAAQKRASPESPETETGESLLPRSLVGRCILLMPMTLKSMKTFAACVSFPLSKT